MKAIRKIQVVALSASFAFASASWAQTSAADVAKKGQKSPSETRAQQFKEQEKTFQQESNSMPASPKVDKNAKSSDPIPKATTKAQKEAQFKAEEKAMQKESGASYGSPKANKSAKAADPIPKAATKAQKEAQFKAEEKAMQKESKQ